MDCLHERLSLLRKERGLTLQNVIDSKATGISSIQVLSNYEKGNREPDFQTLCLLADFYNVSTDYLLGRTEEENPQEIDFLEETGLPKALGNFLLFIRKNTFDEGRIYNEICSLLASNDFLQALRTVWQICSYAEQYNDKPEPSGIEGCKLLNLSYELRAAVAEKTNNFYTVCRTGDVLNGKIHVAQQLFARAIDSLIANMSK